MINFDKIKLIIWDLDETLWKGTISEESVSISSDIKELLADLTDMGIINSICSKNTYSDVEKELKKHQIWDYFVFPSINWESKGSRIKSMIDNMSLRDANVLFIDDNLQNLNEAKFYCENIMTALPNEIVDLVEFAKNAEKKDKEHKRLLQYRILEKKL